MCGRVQRVIMGLDRFKKTSCGFCFIEYLIFYFRYTHHEEALEALKYLSGSRIDDREIRVDLDSGFVEGRQFGRGKSGGQV